MAVQLLGTGGLFDRLGAIGSLLYTINSNKSTAAVSGTDAVAAQFYGDQALVDSIYSALGSYQSAQSGYPSFLQSVATQTLITMVNDDELQPDQSFLTAFVALYRQMQNANVGVAPNHSTATYVPWNQNNSNAQFVISLYDVIGRPLQNLFAEEIVMTCTNDAQSGSAAEGSETITALGAFPQTNLLEYNWPQGSGANRSLTLVNPFLSNSGGNLLTNSSFEDYSTTEGGPDNWTVLEEGAGIAASLTGGTCAGGAALQWTGIFGSAVIQQTFGSSFGTLATLSPLSQYGWMMSVSAVGATLVSGEIAVSLVDENGEPTFDDSGNINEQIISIVGLTSSECTTISGVFRMPRVMPAGYSFRIRVFDVGSGHSIITDHLAMAQLKELYPSGPQIMGISGSLATIQGDYWIATITNDRNGLWQTLGQQLFNFNAQRLMWPIANTSMTGDIPDSLIT